MFRFRRGAAAFEGEVSDAGVDIRRMIGYQNSFLPNIQGSFERTPYGSRLRGTMQMHPLVTIFMCIWIAFVIIVGFAAATLFLLARDYDPAGLIPVGMLLFGWAVPAAAFTIGAGIARRALIEILAAETPSGGGAGARP